MPHIGSSPVIWLLYNIYLLGMEPEVSVFSSRAESACDSSLSSYFFVASYFYLSRAVKWLGCLEIFHCRKKSVICWMAVPWVNAWFAVDTVLFLIVPALFCFAIILKEWVVITIETAVRLLSVRIGIYGIPSRFCCGIRRVSDDWREEYRMGGFVNVRITIQAPSLGMNVGQKI